MFSFTINYARHRKIKVSTFQHHQSGFTYPLAIDKLKPHVTYISMPTKKKIKDKIVCLHVSTLERESSFIASYRTNNINDDAKKQKGCQNVHHFNADDLWKTDGSGVS